MVVVAVVVVVWCIVVVWCSAVAVVYLTTCLSDSLSIYLPTCLSIYRSICKFENEASLRDILNFWTWQHPKNQERSNSARLPQLLNLTTSKTKQFCETSSIFEHDNIKNKAILRDFLQTYKVKCSADSLVPMRFAIFPFHLSKVLRLPRKSDARSYEVLHLSRKIIFPKLKIWCSGNQRPHLLTSLMNTSLVLRIPRKMHLARSSSYVPRLPLFLESYKTLTFCSLLTRCPIPRACHAKPHLNLQKWSEHVVFLCVFDILTWKCASRHNGMHFFNTTTSKSAPNPVCFVHFDFDMCFSPQRRAPSQLPNVVWDRQFFTLLTSSRHRGVKFFLSHLPRWLCTCCFSEPTFRPSRAANHGKAQCFATLLPFRAPAFSFFCFFDSFSSLIFVLLLFFSLSLPTSAFPSVHIVGSLTSKLPSIIISDSFGGPVIFSPSFPDARNSFRNFWLEKSWSLWMTPVRHAWRRSYDLCLMWSKL